MARIAHLDVDAFYAARKFGVGSAMPTARARRLCPDAILIPPDFTAYREASGKVMGLLRAHVERVEVLGLDEAYLDLDGLVAPRAAMRRLVTAIRDQTGLTASVGIGPNKLVAKVCSDAEKPAGFEVLVERFGANHGPDLRRRAAFHGSAHLTTERIAVSESRETTFDRDVADAL